MFWAFTLPYMAYLFGEIVERIKMHGSDSVPVYELVTVPLCLYISIHVIRSLGYYGNNLFSWLSVPVHKARIVHQLFTHLSHQSVAYYENNHTGFLANRITNVCMGLSPIIANLFFIIIPQSVAIIINME